MEKDRVKTEGWMERGKGHAPPSPKGNMGGMRWAWTQDPLLWTLWELA